MPASNNTFPGARQEITNVLKSWDGVEILRMTSEEVTFRDAEGVITTHRRSEFNETMDGQLLSSLMLMGPKPVAVMVCAACREQTGGSSGSTPMHGLVTAQAAVRCTKCSAVLCPSHRHKCSDDEWRCPRCAKRFARRQWLRRLFFVAVEEE